MHDYGTDLKWVEEKVRQQNDSLNPEYDPEWVNLG
jgi:hypothetical protein